ncbi:MAG: T9SS type A sorting domain-containing protein [candidate division WOR-3 bacterium]
MLLRKIVLIVFLYLLAFVSAGESYKLDFDLVTEPTPGEISFNAVCYVPGRGANNAYNRYFAVGDCGWVYILDNDGHSIETQIQLPDGDEYNLSGVSGFRYGTGTRDVLVIAVGYKRETTTTGPKWKGAIWRSTDRGRSWTRVRDENLPQEPEFLAVPVPFLDVKVVDQMYAWVSCGHGYVMRSTDGGIHWFLTPNKPVRPNYMGWYWGIWAPNETEVWVCSDESTIVARTLDGGQNWITYSPFVTDSISFRDIYGDISNPGTVYLVSSKGYLVYTTNNGGTWHRDTPLEMNPPAEWLRGVFPHTPSSPFTDAFVWCVGTGGIIANNNEPPGEELIWYSRKYNFNAIAGACPRNTAQSKFTYVVVGTNRTIMCIEADAEDYPSVIQREQNAQDELIISDWVWDDGWKIYASWEEYEWAEDWYRLYILPAPDFNNYAYRCTSETGWGKRIKEVPIQGPLYVEYDSILIGFNTQFTVTTMEDGEETDIYCEEGMSLDDRQLYTSVTGLIGNYIPNLDAVYLNWDTYPVASEPNLGGYWVCPMIEPSEEIINHPAPIIRNCYVESVPANYPRPFYWGFKVQAMDRSGNRSNWQPNYYFVYVPGRPTLPYATAFTQGRHIVRGFNSKRLHLVNETNHRIIYTYSKNEGETWIDTIIGDGFYPCIGINHKEQPWIAYCKDGDLICKIKRDDGSWKEILIFDGDENHWAGPSSMQLATMPIKEDVIDYAYITYPVYDGSMPDRPGEQPPENIEHSYIYISLFDTTGVDIITHLIDDGPAEAPVSHPCVSVTPADLIHIAWQQKDEIWYITNTEKVTPENWREIEWTPKYNLSNTEEVSAHPFVESYGDIVSVVWKEGNPGEIIKKERYVWEPSQYEKWSDPVNLSNSPDVNSDYAQMATGEVTLWQEGSDNDCKVYANICGKILGLTPDANNVSFVHTNALIIDPKAPEIMLYYCYTDEITPSELYEVKFDKYLFPEGVSGEINEVVYYDGKIGEENISPYCEARTGYIDYGDYTIDYGNTLEYQLKYLNPCKYYLFQAIVYHDTNGAIRQKLEVEDTLETTMRVYPSNPETINIYISPSTYQEDLESALEIVKTRGPFACLAEFKIYEYEVVNDSGSTSGGPQSSGAERLSIPPMLYSPKPNPFNNRTEIRFQIPVKTRVDLKVYNSVGRLVNTLVSDEVSPGYYIMNWNGKDEMGRRQSNGIYFVRLKTQDYDATTKVILIR